MSEMSADLSRLSSAEDFLDYFEIPYDKRVVNVNRLHILRRVHDGLDGLDLSNADDDTVRATYKGLLEEAYQAFAEPGAKPEKTFGVFQKLKAEAEAEAETPAADPARTFVPLDSLLASLQKPRS